MLVALIEYMHVAMVAHERFENGESQFYWYVVESCVDVEVSCRCCHVASSFEQLSFKGLYAAVTW